MKKSCLWPTRLNCYLLVYVVHESKLVLSWINIHKAHTAVWKMLSFHIITWKAWNINITRIVLLLIWELISNSDKCALNTNMWQNFQLAWHFLPSFLAVNTYYFVAHSRALIITLPKTKRQFLINSHILSYRNSKKLQLTLLTHTMCFQEVIKKLELHWFELQSYIRFTWNLKKMGLSFDFWFLQDQFY